AGRGRFLDRRGGVVRRRRGRSRGVRRGPGAGRRPGGARGAVESGGLGWAWTPQWGRGLGREGERECERPRAGLGRARAPEAGVRVGVLRRAELDRFAAPRAAVVHGGVLPARRETGRRG